MKAEIIAQLHELAHQEKVLNKVNAFNELVDEFYKIQQEEEHQWEIKKLERIEAGEKPENIEKPIFKGLEEFKKLSQLFKDKKKIEQNEKRDLEKANLEKKRALVAALKDLVQHEENIGRAINRFRDIQDSWKEVGAIPREKRQEIQKEFSNLIESFRYNINIYKEIKDHDLSRNFTLKQELIKKIKALLKLKKIKDVEQKLHTYQDEWNTIGGTHQDDWEKIKSEYWDAVNAVYEKIHKFYQDRKGERAENIVKKKQLIEKAREITAKEPDSHKAWKKTTDAIIDLQKEWKTIGFGPKEENNKVWKEFRGVCNEFFAKKKEFYGERNEEFDVIKAAKEKLIAEVEALKDSTDWGETTKKIVAIQNQWKKAGSAGPKNENKLWKAFRAPIDQFFEAKDAFFAEADKANEANLKAKQELIKKMIAFKLPADGKKAIDELKSFSEQFAAIGNVPFKEKDKIYKAYKKALDEKYASIKMDAGEKEKHLFQAKIEGYKGARDTEDKLDKETQHIRKKITKLKDEIVQQETNLSFFANADENNPLLKNALQSVEDKKAELELLKAQLKQIRILEQAVEREARQENEMADQQEEARSENE
ncbi:MAG: DUF349 domain-containing protein [Crocinitomicaceae bacterium]